MKNLLLIEAEKNKLYKELNKVPSMGRKFLLISKFYDFIILIGNDPIYKSYIIELIDKYILYAHNYTPFYALPKQTEDILNQLVYLAGLPELADYRERLTNTYKRIEKDYTRLLEILEGRVAPSNSNKPFFPILEIKDGNCSGCTGFIESATIDISIHKNEDVFIIVPSEVEIEERILQQVKTSFYMALQAVKSRYRIKSNFHKIIVQFDLRNGYYTGDSLGTALTIGFMEKLLSVYNTQFQVKIKSGITFTGGIDANSNIKRVTDEIISKKVEIVFFSDTGTFIIPDEDKEAALVKFQELKLQYPNRDLRIIPIKDLYDLLDRRSLIDIKKQNPLIRAAKNVRRHKYSTFLSLLFLLFISFVYMTDYDNNPALLFSEGQTLYVKNKSGRVLWTKAMSYDNRFAYTEFFLRVHQLIMDVNSDGLNEIILTKEMPTGELNKKEGRVVCLDYKGNEIWEYMFTDTISSPLEKLSTEYAIGIIDTVTIGNLKVLYLFANNGPSYSAAIFKLDPKTGQRLHGTLWHPGHICDAFIKDIFNDGKKYLLTMAANNSMEKHAFIIADINNLQGQLPVLGRYKFYNTPLYTPYKYYLFPKTDYAKSLDMRTDSYQSGSFRYFEKTKQVIFNFYESHTNISLTFQYRFDPISDDFSIVIGNDFRVARDSLVAHGKLPLPLTDTPEYCNILKNQILYWNGTEFVKEEP